jgi:hypothetical protein
MIRRETNSDLIDRISNMPGVFEAISKHGRALAWSSGMDGLIVLSNGEDAVGVFEETAPGAYQTHTMFAPTCRGARAVETGRAMLRYMFDNGADTIWGATPINNAKARWFNRKCGARMVGRSVYPVDGAVEVFQVEKSAWSPR